LVNLFTGLPAISTRNRVTLHGVMRKYGFGQTKSILVNLLVEIVVHNRARYTVSFETETFRNGYPPAKRRSIFASVINVRYSAVHTRTHTHDIYTYVFVQNDCARSTVKYSTKGRWWWRVGIKRERQPQAVLLIFNSFFVSARRYHTRACSRARTGIR